MDVKDGRCPVVELVGPEAEGHEGPVAVEEEGAEAGGVRGGLQHHRRLAHPAQQVVQRFHPIQRHLKYSDLLVYIYSRIVHKDERKRVANRRERGPREPGEAGEEVEGGEDGLGHGARLDEARPPGNGGDPEAALPRVGLAAWGGAGYESWETRGRGTFEAPREPAQAAQLAVRPVVGEEEDERVVGYPSNQMIDGLVEGERVGRGPKSTRLLLTSPTAQCISFRQSP